MLQNDQLYIYNCMYALLMYHVRCDSALTMHVVCCSFCVLSQCVEAVQLNSSAHATAGQGDALKAPLIHSDTAFPMYDHDTVLRAMCK
jgi:hypothetical protein